MNCYFYRANEKTNLPRLIQYHCDHPHNQHNTIGRVRLISFIIQLNNWLATEKKVWSFPLLNAINDDDELSPFCHIGLIEEWSHLMFLTLIIN